MFSGCIKRYEPTKHKGKSFFGQECAPILSHSSVKARNWHTGASECWEVVSDFTCCKGGRNIFSKD